MKNSLNYIYILFFLISCNSSNNNRLNSLVTEPDLIEKLKYEKQNLDSLFKSDLENIIVLAKLENVEELVTIKNKTFQNNVINTYNILNNKSGKIVMISESPTSESGDFYIRYNHYFDKNGKTFSFERKTSFFNSICTDEIVDETKTEYYNNEFKLIDNDYKLVDRNGRSLMNDSCVLNYDFEYIVSKNLETYLKTNKIKF